MIAKRSWHSDDDAPYGILVTEWLMYNLSCSSRQAVKNLYEIAFGGTMSICGHMLYDPGLFHSEEISIFFLF
jgi:hypothetical protein